MTKQKPGWKQRQIASSDPVASAAPLASPVEPLFGRGLTLLRFVLATAIVLSGAEAGARVVTADAVVPLVYHDATTQLKADQLGTFADADPPGAGIETVFVGTSVAQQDILPEDYTRLTGSPSYNAALPGAVPTLTTPWLTSTVLQSVEPNHVIWGLTPLDLSEDYGDTQTQAWEEAPASRTDLLGRADRYVGRHSALIRWRTLLRRPTDFLGLGNQERLAEFASAASQLGSSGERLTAPATNDDLATAAAVTRARLGDYVIDSDDLKAILTTGETLRKRDIRLTLVILPVSPSFVTLLPNGSVDMERTRTAIELLAVELEVDVVDLSQGYNDGDFVDLTHLNRQAAERLTAELAGELDA